MDPFAVALDAIFTAPGSAAAIYADGPSASLAIRVIIGQPSEVSPFGRGRVVQASHHVQIRRGDVTPRAGALITVEGATFLRSDLTGSDTLQLMGDPEIDVEGLTWTIGAEPV